MKEVMIISLCLLAAVPASASTKSGAAASSVMSLSSACESFRAHYGVYPPQETWLEELQVGSNVVVNTERLHFAEMYGLRDTWGNAFVYKLPGKHNPESFDLYSTGADGKTKTDGNDADDIASWHEPDRWQKHYNPPIITPFRIVLVVALGVGIALVKIVRKHKIPNKMNRRRP